MKNGINEVKQLTGLCGIAALSVAIGHFNLNNNPALNFLSFGNAAVDIFFCLSAFTLCLVYKAGSSNHLDGKKYGVARFARIFPLYIVALALSAMIRWPMPSTMQHYTHLSFVTDFVRQFLMINAWPVLGTGVFWNMSAWSLSVEFFCYLLVFPALFTLSKKTIRSPEILRTSVIIAAVFVDVIVYMKFYNPDVQAFFGAVPRDWSFVHWVAILRGISMFAAGWLAFLAWQQKEKLYRVCHYLADGFGLAMLVMYVCFAFGLTNDHMTLFPLPFFLIGLMNNKAISSRVLSFPPIVWIGEISYSLYLLHLLTQQIITHYWSGFAQYDDVLRVPMMIAIALSVGAASYYFFERPARFYLRRALLK